VIQYVPNSNCKYWRLAVSQLASSR